MHDPEFRGLPLAERSILRGHRGPFALPVRLSPGQFRPLFSQVNCLEHHHRADPRRGAAERQGPVAADPSCSSRGQALQVALVPLPSDGGGGGLSRLAGAVAEAGSGGCRGRPRRGCRHAGPAGRRHRDRWLAGRITHPDFLGGRRLGRSCPRIEGLPAPAPPDPDQSQGGGDGQEPAGSSAGLRGIGRPATHRGNAGQQGGHPRPAGDHRLRRRCAACRGEFRPRPTPAGNGAQESPAGNRPGERGAGRSGRDAGFLQIAIRSLDQALPNEHRESR